jgi:hypothetical protein
VTGSTSRRDTGSVAYWAGAGALIILGFLTLFSIAAPLFLTGVVMVWLLGATDP